MEQDYQNIREEYNTMARQLEEAEKDVQRLLIKRESIQNIQKILIDLTRGPTSSQQINSAVDEIRDILGSTQSRPNPNPTKMGDKIPQQDNVPLWYKKLTDKKK
jgi:flagellar biosynthesis component FlhA